MDIALRAVVVFAFIYLVTRLIGRRELSSLEPFDLILLIILGDTVQQGLTQDDYSLTGAVIAISVIALLQVTDSYANYRFPRLRPLLDGEPVVILQDGQLIERNLARERLTPEEVAEQARIQQIKSLDDVEWAVLETSGEISFIPKKS
jgi:uncharacterized membrane protein YcaP (DUF421 family)